MAGFGIDGLSSGLNTTALIASLMQIESMPRTQLQNSASAVRSQVSAWQTLNSTVQTLGARAAALTTATSAPPHTASSSLDSVTVRTTAGASPASIDVRIDRSASTHTGVTASFAANADPVDFVVVAADGTEHAITAASGAAADIAAALRGSPLGLRATVIAAGTDPVTGDSLSRLQIQSSSSGAAGSFQVLRGTSADRAAGTATDVFAEPGAALITAGQDAQITLWAGTAAEQALSSSTSTFADVLPGVSLTLGVGASGTARINVARDGDALRSAVDGLITGLTGVLSYLTTATLVTTSTSSAGTSTTRAGVLAGDFTAREVRSRVTDAIGQPVNGRSPSTVGISFTSTGEVTFDAERLAAALASDPEGTMATVSAIASRASATAEQITDRFDGIVTKRIAGNERRIADVTTQIESWDRRLELRRAALERTYASLEVQLGRLSQQSAWLGSQLASLSGMGAAR